MLEELFEKMISVSNTLDVMFNELINTMLFVASFIRASVHCTVFHINPLTPMPALTGRDKPWPFFHF